MRRRYIGTTYSDPLQVVLVPTPVSVCGGSDGAIDLDVSGGTPPLSFDWSNGSTAQDISQLPAGPYSVTVNDNGGQHRSASTSLTQPEIELSLTVTDVSVEGGSDGAVDLSVTGEGTPPYSFLWSNGGQGGSGTLVGEKMKTHASPSGFDALFTGYWDPGSFFNEGNEARYWSSTEWNEDERDNWYYGLNTTSGVQRSVWDKRSAFSVRLVRDDPP